MSKEQSSEELSSLAAKFLNESDDEAYQASPDDRWLDLVKLTRRFAASVLTQDETPVEDDEPHPSGLDERDLPGGIFEED